jgi:type II pantothenate kinase
MMGLTMIHPGFARSRKDANMDIVLGIDIGGSTTKIVGLRRDGSVVSMLRVRAEDQVTSLYGALGNYLTSNGLSLGDVRRIVLTGVGASYVDGDIYGLPTCKVDEFSASGTGALALSGQSSAVVVTMGTGTAFLWAEEDGSVRHLCGSGIGGGTLGGLCHKLVGMERFGQIKKLAEQGDLTQVDLTIRDITRNPAPTLDPTLTAANFGNLAEDAAPADLAAGAVNLVLQAIGTMTVLACQCCKTQTVVLTGSMTSLPQVKTNFENFEKLYGIHYIIPENASFATAIGAGLYSLKKQAVEAKG